MVSSSNSTPGDRQLVWVKGRGRAADRARQQHDIVPVILLCLLQAASYFRAGHLPCARSACHQLCNAAASSCCHLAAEARGGLHVVEQSLWAAVPSFLRRLSAALKKHTGRELPLNATPIRFGSWMGGDRDGNPNVTAKTTHHVVALSR